ncbi:GNAT family N-acetyltransferase [Roseibium litorale]|uniref:GNAT family N-acetyltransferase n=1 Tax=Roseibium litorale TaxID=2803841 RepID=A0ABR9CKM2_9HYPH|nr:GNAT family N-acetyltransferase [Roseibium litorale]MBD8890965.1 GNAT family N-acetyltransferase [Roseibium litorale]
MLTDDTIILEPFGPQHISGAHRLSKAANWPHREEDWMLFQSLSRGLAMIEKGEVVATALTTPFGPVATVNMIIVDERMRGRGLGRKIMSGVMELAAPQEWRLIATEEGRPLYEKLGFEAYGDVVQHQGIAKAATQCEPLAAGDADGLHLAAPADAGAIASLDRDASGMDRSGLIEALLSMGQIFVLREAGRITGFAVLRPFGRGEVLGPVAAADAGEAKRLMSHIISHCEGRFLRVDTTAGTGLSPWLEQHGLTLAGGGTAMRLGKAEPVSPTMNARTFALAAQALG